jgi:antitoxin (DNA-binding transcriptional repressor) of toxin-antitoxin stability system
VEVTERGHLVALLVPPSPGASVRDRLVASGRLRPARTSFQPPRRRVSVDKRRTASDALAGLRGERII